MRTKLIAGNWKMNGGPVEARSLLEEINNKLKNSKRISDVLVCPPYVSLHVAVSALKESSVHVGAQNVHYEDNGAYTGEISTEMLKETGSDFVVIGHSERREYFGDTDEIISRKVQKAIKDGLQVILCVGEKLEQRKNGFHEQVVVKQLKAVAENLSEGDLPQLTIAYEPVWAIGTGETATPDQAQEMHLFIRNYLAGIWNSQSTDKIRILYGGSMKPQNAEELLHQPDVDGGLIGGASLKADSFCEIIEIADRLSK